jgi:hypothetical protein
MKLFAVLALAIGLLTGAATANAASGVPPADKAALTSTLEAVVKQAESGNIPSVDATIDTLKGAVEKGKAIIAAVAAQDPANRKVLEFVAASVDKMYGETLQSIEDNWHRGDAVHLAGLGETYDKIAKDSPAIVAIDSVVHPVTAILALQAYKKDQKTKHLNQVAAELKELLEAMKNL